MPRRVSGARSTNTFSAILCCDAGTRRAVPTVPRCKPRRQTARESPAGRPGLPQRRGLSVWPPQIGQVARCTALSGMGVYRPRRDPQSASSSVNCNGASRICYNGSVRNKSPSASIVLLYSCVACVPASAQAQLGPDCPVIATLPADINWTEPLESRQRFQLRQCYGALVIVECFEKGKITPTLTFDTGYGYPSYLVHSLNVLVFQSTGGSADQVLVLLFNRGKPSVGLKTATKDHIQVIDSDDGTLRVTVPPPTHPGRDGKFPPTPQPTTYSFPIQY